MRKTWHYLIIPYKEGLVTKEFLLEQTNGRCINPSYKEMADDPSHYFIRLIYGSYLFGTTIQKGYELQVSVVDKVTIEQLRDYVERWIETGDIPAGSTLDLDPSINPRQWILEHVTGILNDFRLEPLIE